MRLIELFLKHRMLCATTRCFSVHMLACGNSAVCPNMDSVKYRLFPTVVNKIILLNIRTLLFVAVAILTRKKKNLLVNSASD